MTMYAEERQHAMAQLVTERGRVSVNAIAETAPYYSCFSRAAMCAS